jgi:hypothetical protein
MVGNLGSIDLLSHSPESVSDVDSTVRDKQFVLCLLIALSSSSNLLLRCLQTPSQYHQFALTARLSLSRARALVSDAHMRSCMRALAQMWSSTMSVRRELTPCAPKSSRVGYHNHSMSPI